MPEASHKDEPARTSLDTYNPTDSTVQFRHWTSFQGTAYQRGQQAGFNRRDADRLIQHGAALLVVPMQASAAPGRTVTK